MPSYFTSRRRRVGAVLTAAVAATALLTVVMGRHGGEAEPFDPFLVELQERTFRYFWETANPENGLVPDRYPTPSYASIAAVGFGLTTYPIGAERGYITRAQARERVLATLRFLRNAPQGHAAKGMTGYKGFFYHFVEMKTGQRFEESELSTVDTAILLAGALFCQSYFDGAHPASGQRADHPVEQIPGQSLSGVFRQDPGGGEQDGVRRHR